MERQVEVRVLQALERIAEALCGIDQSLQTITEADPEPVDERCLHPMDQRIPFGWTNGREDFQCKVCGFRVSESVEVPGHA